MGGISLTRARSLQRFFPNFHAQDWQQVPVNKLEGQSRFGQYTTLRNKITKQQIDRYHLTFYTDKQQRIYEQCFMQRLRQQYLPLKNPGICSSIRGAVVYIQHILIRLSDITDIPIDESLYITKCALYGFQKLYNESGYFQVMEEHIGIDKEGRVRVWLNADVSKNYPSGYEQESAQSRDNERTMVAEIITMIEKNTSLQSGNQHEDNLQLTPISISAYMQKNHTKFPSFRQAQQLIRQYANKYQIHIPKHCKSVVEIFQEDYGEDFNLTNASSFGENLDIGGNQLFQEQKNSQRSRQRQDPINLNMMSSRSRVNTLFVQPNNNGDRPNSFLRENQGNLESRQQSYKQYQPISIYKPNQKSKRISIADDNGPYVQVIKSDSQSSSIHSQRHSLHGSQHASQPNYTQSHHTRSHNRSQSNHNQTQSIHGSGYNLSGSQYSNNFQIRVVQQPRHSNKSLSPIDIAGLTQLGRDQRSSRVKQQQNMKLRQSGASYSKMSKQSSKIYQNQSIPKITFNYVNRSELINSDRISSVQPINTKTELTSLNYSQRNGLEQNQQVDTDRDVDLQLEKDIEKQLRFIQGNQEQNRITFDPNFKRKSDTFQNGIVEDNQDSIDPQIMRDLLKQFPTFEEDKENHNL